MSIRRFHAQFVRRYFDIWRTFFTCKQALRQGAVQQSTGTTPARNIFSVSVRSARSIPASEAREMVAAPGLWKIVTLGTHKSHHCIECLLAGGIHLARESHTYFRDICPWLRGLKWKQTSGDSGHWFVKYCPVLLAELQRAKCVQLPKQ